MIGAYLIVIVAGALWLPTTWDWAEWDWLSSFKAPVFDTSEIAIVDLPWQTDDLAKDRTAIATFLRELAAHDRAPTAVVLDVQFGPCQTQPCESKMGAARDALVAGIRAVEARAPVYALEQPELDGTDHATSLDPHDPVVYSALSGAAHTRFTEIANPPGRFYRACYEVPITDANGTVAATSAVWDMVERVAMRPEIVAHAACDQNPIAVRLPADPITPAAASVVRLSPTGTFGAATDFERKYVIVGTLEYDRKDPAVPGPELLGWALSDALNLSSGAGAERAYDTEPSGDMLLALVPGFSIIATLAYVAIFFLLRNSRLRQLRPALPWISALGATLVGLGLLAAFEALLLVSGHVQPQVTLIVLGIVVASLLSAVRAFQWLFDQTYALERSPTETFDYDVFISYAHEEGAWVFEHVYVPLRDARLPDGRKLTIFFDTDSIRYGTAWQEKITLSIDGSRIVVPVYSETYFGRPYCKFEIMRAHLKWIQNGPQSRCVLPIMRGKPAIPSTVSDIQATSIEEVPELVSLIVAEIVERIGKLVPPAAGKHAAPATQTGEPSAT